MTASRSVRRFHQLFLALAAAGMIERPVVAVVPFRTVALSGQQPPGTPPGARFLRFGSEANASFDRALIRAALEPNAGGVDSLNDSGIWSFDKFRRPDPLELHLVALEGSQAPGAPSGAVFDDFVASGPVMNNVGQIVFSGTLRTGSGGVDASNRYGIWSGRPGDLELVARGGDQAPDTPIGAKFDSLFAQRINGLGRTAFQATLQLGSGGVTTSNIVGLWSDGLGVLALVARRGDQAPGAPADAVFEDFDTGFINDAGRIAFRTRLRTGAGGVDDTVGSDGSGGSGSCGYGVPRCDASGDTGASGAGGHVAVAEPAGG